MKQFLIMTFLNDLKAYITICANTSTIHGLKYLVMCITGTEKLLWTLLLGFALYGYIFLALQTWNRYQVNPEVITLDLDYYNWNITFPSITMCLALKNETIDKYLKLQYSHLSNKDKAELKNFYKVLYTQSSFRAFDKIYDFDLMKKEDYLETLLQLNNFNPDIQATFESKSKLVKIITEVGICYAYNSEIALYYSESYWKANRWDIVDTKTNLVKIDANILGGMTTTISNFENEYWAFLRSYNDIIDYASPKYMVQNKGILRLFLKIQSLWTTQDAIELTPSQRKCRLIHESNLRHSPVYSVTACKIECRIELCLRYCKCLPYFYRKLDSEEICDPSGMRCLANYADILENLYDNERNISLCNCLPNCNWDFALIDNFENAGWLFGSSLSWEVIEFPRIRYRKELIFGLSNVMISIGGMAGLFLGCGILSFVEILYYVSIKFIWFLYNRRKNKNKNRNAYQRRERIRI